MAKRAETKPAERTPLSKERVLRAALELADADGIEALSMRRLAQELGVEAMSLYNHVANKGEILDGLVDLAVSEIELPDGGEDWIAAVRQCAISAHEAFRRHPWACALAMSPGSSRNAHPSRLRYMDWLLGRLRDGGLSDELTYRGYHAIDSHILGFTLWELGHAAGGKLLGDQDVATLIAGFVGELRGQGYTHVAEHAEQHLAPPTAGGVGEFEFGLDLILAGPERATAAE